MQSPFMCFPDDSNLRSLIHLQRSNLFQRTLSNSSVPIAVLEQSFGGLQQTDVN